MIFTFGPVVVGRGRVATIAIQAPRPFQGILLDVNQGREMTIVSLAICNREQLAMEVPVAMFTEAGGGIVLEICPANGIITLAVRNDTDASAPFRCELHGRALE